MEEKLKITGHGTLHNEKLGSSIKMTPKIEEKFKITGEGSLHNETIGSSIKIDNKQYKSKVIYDSNLNQYCVDGQWEIPFNQSDQNISKFEEVIEQIKNLKTSLVKEQKYEYASYIRDMEKTLIDIMDEYINKTKGE